MKSNYFSLLLALFFAANSAGVLAKEPDVSFFASPWQSKCQETPPSKEKICVLEKYIFEDKNQRNRIGGIGVRTSSLNKNIVITIISPLGISLSSGVEIGANGENSSSHPFIFCDNGGCVSQFIGDEKLISLLTNKKELSLGYQLLNGKKIVINIGLENFKELFNSIRQQ